MKNGLVFCETQESVDWYKEQVKASGFSEASIDYRVEKGISSLSDEDFDKYHLIKVSPYYGYELYSNFTIHNDIERMIEHCDLSFESKSYSLLYKNMIKEIRHVNPKMDTYGEAIISCKSLLLKPFVLVATHLGFKKIKIVSDDVRIAETHLKDLQKHIFGAEVSIVLPKNLTLLPSSCSLFLNGMENDVQQELVLDLSYLNFIKNNGLVVDIFMSQANGPIIEECMKINIPFISGLKLESLAILDILNHLKK